MRQFIQNPPQTNEVRRCGALLPGFLTVAQETGLPLRCLEVGSSAGLLQLWDKFHYRLGEKSWGDPNSPIVVDSDWRGNAPELMSDVTIAERAGCDIRPIDLADEDARIRMEAYVWPDHTDRVERLRSGMQMVLDNQISVDHADAASWVEQRLADPAKGMATVLFHSITAQYFDDKTAERFEAAITEAGRRATSDAPMAWLSLEHVNYTEFPYLELTIWPGGEKRRMGQAHPHGHYVDWL